MCFLKDKRDSERQFTVVLNQEVGMSLFILFKFFNNP